VLALALTFVLGALPGCGGGPDPEAIGKPVVLSPGMEKMKAEMLENFRNQTKGRIPTPETSP
jgi:hypothetical protein